MAYDWSDWMAFPDPRKGGILTAPFGPGCYELRNGEAWVLFGQGRHVAERMSSLLPAPLGKGTRNNSAKRAYVLENMNTIEYRVLACETAIEAIDQESTLKISGKDYLFKT